MTQAPVPHLLLLAGSGESRELAARLVPRGGVTASVPDCPRTFGPLPVPTRIGRFGGESGLAQYIESAGIGAVLDATHPFAAQMGRRASAVCARLGLPFARLLRPAWRPGPGDVWTEVPSEAEVRHHLRPGQRVFATTGRATLEALAGDVPARFLVRRMAPDTPPDDMKNVEYIIGKGPFSVEEEIETLSRLKIDVLVARNAGGTPSRSKVEAARALGLPVILIARPPQPPGPRLRSVAEALQWVAAL